MDIDVNEPDLLTASDVLGRFEWTIADFRSARDFGFPPPIDHRRNTQRKTVEPLWSRRSIERWAREIAALTARGSCGPVGACSVQRGEQIDQLAFGRDDIDDPGDGDPEHRG